MDKHQLLGMSTEVSYQILFTVQTLISGGAWDLLYAPHWSNDRSFATYNWGLKDGTNKWMLGLRKGMKPGDKSVEMKVLGNLINHVIMAQNMNDVFVKVGTIKAFEKLNR